MRKQKRGLDQQVQIAEHLRPVAEQLSRLVDSIQELLERVQIRIEAPDGDEIKSKVLNELWRMSNAGARVIHVRGVWSDSGKETGDVK